MRDQADPRELLQRASGNPVLRRHDSSKNVNAVCNTKDGCMLCDHGVRVTASGSVCRLGPALPGRDDPTRVVERGNGLGVRSPGALRTIGRSARRRVPGRRVTRPALPAPVAWHSAPRRCGPWEQVVANLTDVLVKFGSGVSLQPTGDSGTRV